MRAYWVDSLVKIGLVRSSTLCPVNGCGRRCRSKASTISTTGKPAPIWKPSAAPCAASPPWLELEGLDGEEREKQQRLRLLARQAIAAGVDPDSPDYLNFATGGQRLVDAAFLAHALLRAPHALWEELPPVSKTRLVTELKRTRAQKPFASNWLLFSAMIEAFFCVAGVEDWDSMRIDYALRQHDQWYKGDGMYGDGAALPLRLLQQLRHPAHAGGYPGRRGRPLPGLAGHAGTYPPAARPATRPSRNA